MSLLYLLCTIVFCQLARSVSALEGSGVGKAGRRSNRGGQLPDSSHQPTPLGTSAHSAVHQDALIYRLHIQPFISLSPLILLSRSLSLFNFPLKNRSHIKQPSMAAAVPLLKEQRNDLISSPLGLCSLLSLLIHRSLDTQASFPSPCEATCRA